MDVTSRIILDNGSGYLKCGLSNQNIPQFTIPALIGRPMLRYEENIDEFKIKVNTIIHYKSIIISLSW